MTETVAVTREGRLEKESFLAIQQSFLPWRVTRPAQGDDFGRDGFVQVIDEQEGRHCTVSPLVFALQAKSTEAPFQLSHMERFQVRHLELWSASEAPVTVVAVWSKSSQDIRLRTARDIVTELNCVRPEWKERQRVSVSFKEKHSIGTPGWSLASLKTQIQDELDIVGGRSTLHRFRRRVLLTDIYMGKTTTEHRLQYKGPGGRRTIFRFGPGWQKEDLDPRDIWAPRVLTAAFFLYEEVWYNAYSSEAVARALGAKVFRKLLAAARLIPYRLPSTLGYVCHEDGVLGELASIKGKDSDSVRNFHTYCLGVSENVSGSQELGRDIVRSTRLIKGIDGEGLLVESRRDLARHSVRNLLGLGQPKEQFIEAPWDAGPVNRVIHMNLAHTVARSQALDVVELEGGLSRLASEKWYSTMHFHRNYNSSGAFDAVLRSSGVPDIGLVAETLGIEKCISLAESQRAQDFRDWFWATAADLVGSGSDISQCFIDRFVASSRLSLRSSRLPCDLKLRFLQKVGQEYVVGSPMSSPRIGFSTRVSSDSSLRVQARNHHRRRLSSMRARYGKISRNRSCPCESGTKFKHCCGSMPRA